MCIKQKLFEYVNSQTNKQSKVEAMVRPGLALRRLIATMADHRDIDIPFLFSKLDIKYAFSDEGAWKFCYLFPLITFVNSIDDIEIVFPNSLEMGWREIPPFF